MARPVVRGQAGSWERARETDRVSLAQFQIHVSSFSLFCTDATQHPSHRDALLFEPYDKRAVEVLVEQAVIDATEG